MIYNKLKADIGVILNALIERKPEIVKLAAEACPDDIHLMLGIPPKYSVSEIV